jgi:hypothetical protein
MKSLPGTNTAPDDAQARPNQMPELTPEQEKGLREEWVKWPAGITSMAPSTQREIEPAPGGCGPRFSSAARRATISRTTHVAPNQNQRIEPEVVVKVAVNSAD